MSLFETDKQYCYICAKYGHYREMILLDGRQRINFHSWTKPWSPTQGCFQCSNCGRLTCWTHSDDRLICDCGANNWIEKVYLHQELDNGQPTHLLNPTPFHGNDIYDKTYEIEKHGLTTIVTLSLEKYWKTHDESMLTQAIDLSKMLLDIIPKSDPDRHVILTNYGIALSEKYEKTGNIEQLNISIDTFYEAKDSTPANHKDYAGRLTNLGSSIRNRYIRSGHIDDLESSIKLCSRAVDLTKPQDKEYPSRLNNLAIGFYDRFKHIGNFYDLGDSIKYKRKALDLSTETTEKIQYNHNLAVSLLEYSKYSIDTQQTIKYLDDAIFYELQAVDLLADSSPYKSGCFQCLGDCYHAKFLSSKNIESLTNAIDTLKQVEKLLTISSPQYKMCINSLASAYQDYGLALNQVSYLEKAITLFRQSNQIDSLAKALIDKYYFTKDKSLLNDITATFKKSATRYSDLQVHTKLKSHTNWLSWAFSRGSYAEVGEAYLYTHNASSNILKIQFFREHKESWIQDMQGIAVKAAYAFAKLDKPKEATEAIEQGQARLLSESLAITRTDLTALQNTEHAHLYDAYQETTQRWHWAQQHKPEELKSIREQLDGIIEQIRQLPGYAEFLKPSGWADIELAAADTPLLYVLATEHGGLGLLVHRRDAENAEDLKENSAASVPLRLDIKSIWLPNFTETALQEMLQSYLQAYNAWLSAEEENHDAAFGAWCNALDKTTRRLWDCVFAPLQNKLPEELVLIPAGLLNLLPLHAAWTADDRGGRRYALDNWRIRYAPNARSLHTARALREQTDDKSLLAVENPKGDITYAAYATHALRRYYPQAAVYNHPSQATHDKVFDALRKYDILHFYCHGKTDTAQPLQSLLALANENLTLETLLEKGKIKARLALLCACETGVPGTKLPDEVVSLAAGLLQAGVAGVVSSLWSVADFTTMLLMNRFYQLWREDCPDNPAEALRQAQQWIRDSSLADFRAYFQAQMQQNPIAAELYRYFAHDPRFAFADPQQRPFAHPFYWAAFGYVGV